MINKKHEQVARQSAIEQDSWLEDTLEQCHVSTQFHGLGVFLCKLLMIIPCGGLFGFIIYSWWTNGN